MVKLSPKGRFTHGLPKPIQWYFLPWCIYIYIYIYKDFLYEVPCRVLSQRQEETKLWLHTLPWQLAASLPLQIDGWGRWIFLCFSAAFAASFGEATNVPFLLPGGCSPISHSTARRYWRCVQFSYLGCWCGWWMLTWLIACSTRVLIRMWIHLAPFPCFDMFFFIFLKSWSLQDVFSLLGDDQKFICIFHIGKTRRSIAEFPCFRCTLILDDLHDFEGLEDDDDFCLVKRLLGRVWD